MYELHEGQSICPYHYEYGSEEWVIVLRGQPMFRHPDGEDILEPGDVVCFPDGPAGAHKLTNASAETVRVILLSDKPDSPSRSTRTATRSASSRRTSETRSWCAARARVEYFDGEL